MTTSDYTSNSVAASMRLLVLASSLRDAVEDATMQMLHHIASTRDLGLTRWLESFQSTSRR